MDPSRWSTAFLLTLAIETPVFALGLTRSMGLRMAVLLAVLANLLTHPIAWHLIMRRLDNFPWRFLAIEAGVTLVEAAIIFIACALRGRPDPARVRLAVAVAITANAASAGIGLFL